MFLMIGQLQDKFVIELHDDTDNFIVFKNQYTTYAEADADWEVLYKKYIKVYWEEKGKNL